MEEGLLSDADAGQSSHHEESGGNEEELLFMDLHGLHGGSFQRCTMTLVTYPGGQPRLRPPSRCRWMWKTVWPASALQLKTVR